MTGNARPFPLASSSSFIDDLLRSEGKEGPDFSSGRMSSPLLGKDEIFPLFPPLV